MTRGGVDRTGEAGAAWPPSNYPILGAVLLLSSAAAALALGLEEAYANRLAVWSYYLLVIGVAVRIGEAALPEGMAGIGGRVARVAPTGRAAGPSVYGEAALYVAAVLFATAAYSSLVDPGAVRFLPPLGAGAAALVALHLVRGRR